MQTVHYRNAQNVRKECHLTQDEAATLLGVHYSIISKFEAGKAEMSARLVRKLAGIYSEILQRTVSMEELMRDKDLVATP